MQNPYDKSTLKERLFSHKLWVDSLGKLGKKLNVMEAYEQQNSSSELSADKEEIKVDWQEYDFTGVNFSGAIIPGVNFARAKLINCDFYGCNLASAIFYEAQMSGVSMVKANADYASFENADLHNCNAFRTTFVHASFKGADLTQSNLFKTSLCDINFENAILKEVDFTRAFIKQARFFGANLQGAKGLEGLKPEWIDWIDIGTAEQPLRLSGEAAKGWLLEQANKSEST